MDCNTTGSSSQKVNSADFVCLICAGRFASEKQYYGHLRIHTGEFLWTCDQCPECDIKFDSQAKLNYHKNLCHNIVRPYKCQECGLVFDRASQLEYHQRSVHLGEKSHICQICEKGFFRKTDLRTHTNIHLGTDVSICEICGRKFNHVSNLIRHSRTHAGIKPYPCTVCGKRFTQISSLARHKKIHDRGKEGNDITSQDTGNNTETNLKDHVSESNEITKDVGTSQRKIIKRQHYCKVCGESFQFALLLRKHEKEHMNSCITFDCKSCKRRFENSEDIKEHSCRCIRAIKVKAKRNKSRPKTKQIIVDQRNVHEEVESTIQNEFISTKELTQALSGEDQNLETVLYVTAEQMSHSNIEEFEEVSSNLLRDHILEFSNTADDFNTSSNENVDLEREVSALDSYSDVNDLAMVVPKILEIEGFSENQIDVNNFVSRKQISKESVKCRYTKLEFQESITTSQYFLNIESQDSNTNLEMEYMDTNEIEPTLHLVQTETGEEFYELAMDNISEKPQTKPSENIEENIIESVENLQDLELFRADAQSNFEVYTCGDFGTFDRTNYENCAKQLLELVQFEKQKEGDSTCLADNSEKLLALIENPGFNEINNKEEQNAKGTADSKENSSSIAGEEFDFSPNFNPTQTENVKENKKSKNEKETQSRNQKTYSEEFRCCVCRKTLSTRYNYKQHMGLHYKEHQRFHCKDCSMSFAWKSTLNKHIMNNHRPDGRQTFACNICPKVYCNISLVNEHVKRDHLKERKHVCPICEKSFFKKFDLKTHHRTHTDDKPYQCSFCEKRFYHLSHVIRHERIHTGEKPERSSRKVHKQKHQ